MNPNPSSITRLTPCDRVAPTPFHWPGTPIDKSKDGLKGATFKEYIREELHTFSEGMSWDVKRHFRFVNIAGGAYHDITITDSVIATDYTVTAAAA